MRIGASDLTLHVLLGAVLGLSACAQRPPVQAAAAPARPVEQPAAKPSKLTKAKRVDPNCGVARVDLSAERKEELFRQFEAELGPGTAAVATPDPAPVPRCKQVAG